MQPITTGPDPLEIIVNRSQASQNKEELLELMRWLYIHQPEVVLEIGVDKGHSLLVWEEALRPRKIIGIELLPLTLDDPNLVLLSPADSHDIGTVERVKEALGGDTIDFLFIDGDHTYEGVKRDWLLCRKFLSPDAYVVFHDISVIQEGVEVFRFWREIKQVFPYQEFIKEGGTGTGLIFYDPAHDKL